MACIPATYLSATTTKISGVFGGRYKKSFSKGFYNLRKQLRSHKATTGFLLEMSFEERAQKFHTDDVPLPRSG